jgi:hypothetical protein
VPTVWGFGIPSLLCSATHDHATYHTILHFIWTFLDPSDRKAATKVSPAWSSYHRLQVVAATIYLAPLQVHRAPPGQPTQLPKQHSILYACALLRFHFYYGDFVQWLGGNYVSDYTRHLHSASSDRSASRLLPLGLLYLHGRCPTKRAA